MPQSTKQKPRRRLPGVPMWVERLIRLLWSAGMRVLALLTEGFARELGQMVLGLLLVIVTPAAFVRRSWRAAMFGRRAASAAPAVVRRRLRGAMVRRGQALAASSLRWFDRRVANPAGYAVLCVLLCATLSGMVRMRLWREALFGRRR